MQEVTKRTEIITFRGNPLNSPVVELVVNTLLNEIHSSTSAPTLRNRLLTLIFAPARAVSWATGTDICGV